MKLSLLYDFFKGDKTPRELKDALLDEVTTYGAGLKKKGSSVPIYVTEDVKIFFGEKELSILGTCYLTHQLTDTEIGYIADALLLSESVEFKDEKVHESLELLTDPEINGALTEKSVRELLRNTAFNL